MHISDARSRVCGSRNRSDNNIKNIWNGNVRRFRRLTGRVKDCKRALSSLDPANPSQTECASFP